MRHNEATPILIRQATIYPQGRFRSILLKGIDPDQKILSIPSSLLNTEDGTIPTLIGARMARSTGLHKGDDLTVQWRDVHGTFDARDVRIVEVFKTIVQEIDNEQLWIPLDRLQEITEMPNEATVMVLNKIRLTGQPEQPPTNVPGWEFKDLNFLLRDIHELVRSKSIGGSIMYLVLLFLAMLAIFDTQVLSIWRRKKEMGTLMAMGMTRSNIIGLFTLEGGFHAILAAVVGAIYGIPLLGYAASTGFAMPEAVDSFGFAIGERIFPIYSAGLIGGTTILVSFVTTVVSFLPTRKIAKLKPTDALRGKMS
ncbi:MAG: FtsX-like permease family protein [bacterium]